MKKHKCKICGNEYMKLSIAHKYCSPACLYESKKQKPSNVLSKKKKPLRSKPVSKYKEIYKEYFGYEQGDFIPCEICGNMATEIHHILYRSQGGKDEVGNLIACCRFDHDRMHFKTDPEKSSWITKEQAFDYHIKFIQDYYA